MAFDYKFPVAPTDNNSKSTFVRGFQHKDWVDGQDVVQAQATPGEDGFNARFHKIESDIDALAANMANAFASINVLRSQLVEVLTEIKTQFNLPPAKTAKEGKDVKDFKDGKDGKDGKDTKDTKDAKDGKDTKDTKDAKDGKDGKDGKDTKDTKDHKDGKDGSDKGGAGGLDLAEKQNPERVQAPASAFGMADFLWTSEVPPAEPSLGRSFIQPDERPPVGRGVIDRASETES